MIADIACQVDIFAPVERVEIGDRVLPEPVGKDKGLGLIAANQQVVSGPADQHVIADLAAQGAFARQLSLHFEAVNSGSVHGL
ncbi:hypothetical protein [Rhodophyticola sp.]|uniref:hypothetical protein n=1 Tax=Rhodophyticola sp. TaxID=2680032 RepID=UPI003D2A6251